jgi:hypothetical protein
MPYLEGKLQDHHAIWVQLEGHSDEVYIGHLGNSEFDRSSPY